MNRYLEYFLDTLVIERGSPNNTIISYKADVEGLIDFTIKELQFITREDIKKYIIHLCDNYAMTSVHRKISAFRGVFSFLMNENIINDNPMKFIELPKRQILLPKILSNYELETIFSFLEEDADGKYYDFRLYIIFELLYATGLRISEMLSIKKADIIKAIDLDMPLVIVGKNNKERMVFLHDKISRSLVEYLSTLSKRSIWLFPGDDRGKINKLSEDRPLTRQRVGQLFKILAEYLGIDPTRISPHKLRHSFATAMLNREVDVRMIQEMLGHASISTTQIYTHIAQDKMIELLEKVHPLNKIYPNTV